MSFLGINIAGSALDTFQDAENVTSQNIANVQTPGASRQVVNIGQLPPIDGATMYPSHLEPGTQGTGIYVSSIQRIHQDSYDALFRGASSSQYYYTSEQGVLQGLQSSLGEPANGVNSALTAFQTAVQTLVNNPSGTAERTGILTTANGVVTALNSANNAITSSQGQIQTQATSVVKTVNTTLDQIAALNSQIRAATAVGDNPNTYEDQRDQLIDTLSQYMTTSTSVQADGSTLVTVNGHALVNDTVAYHLAAPVVGTSASGTPELKIGFVTDSNPSNPTAISFGGGSLGALIDVYNNKLQPYSNQLNDFANGLASESDRLSEAGYDLTGAAGGQLFAPVVSTLPVSAGNIQVGISTTSEVPAALATTSAGTLVQPLNASNTTVDTTVALTGNNTLANPPATGLTGNLTIKVDGITQTFAYNTGAGGGQSTIDGFVNTFNAGHYGVTASFDSSSQSIVFSRDPTNIDLVHRAAMAAAGGSTTPDFTITDSNLSVPPPAHPALGTPSTSLLGALGADQISSIDQNSSNAVGVTTGSGANALLSIFSASLGAPAIQTTSTAGITAAQDGTVVTLTAPTAGAYSQLNVGDVLTIDGGAAGQENVTVTAINRAGNGSISFVPKNVHAAGFSITSAQTQTLQQYYANLIAKVGQDTSTAITGTTSQTTLASNINAVRQSTDGINIDEETQNLVKFQNAYGAAAHVVSVLSAMLSDAINLGTGSTF